MACKKLLNLIIEAMKDEKYDREKYRRMIGMTSSNLIRNQIRYGYIDEGNHYKLFRNLYHQLTGKWIDVARPPLNLASTLIGNVKASINGELAAVKMYHDIYSMLTRRSQRDTVLGIMQDEQEHATRLVYVYSILTK